MNRWIKIAFGPITGLGLYALISSFLGADQADSMARMGAVAGWMAAWWMLEAVPLAVTAMLPIFLYPFLSIMSTSDVAPSYMKHIMFLFVGGFLMAFAMERWNLHKRIALRIILAVGTDINKILLGLMLASYLLSMWMSNTATTLMLIPTTLAVISRITELLQPSNQKFAVGYLLGIAFAASIGGTATIIGTPPNIFFIEYFNDHFVETAAAMPEIGFLQWFMFGLPLSLIFLGATYWVIQKRYCSSELKNSAAGLTLFQREYDDLGPMSRDEKYVLGLFIMLAIAWITRADIEFNNFTYKGWGSLFPPKFMKDSTIAMLVASLLFIIPSKTQKGSMLMDWKTAKKLPFDIILVFGGGFALAKGFEHTGLTGWLAAKLDFIQHIPIPIMILIICLFMTFLTELTSNMATVSLVLPLFGSIAVASGINPLWLLIPATFSASFAFMLPVATAPNMIVYGTEKLPLGEMKKTGFILNLIGAVLATLMFLLLGQFIFGIG